MSEPIELKAAVSGSTSLQIELTGETSAEEIARLLSAGRAMILGSEILLPSLPPSHGHVSVLAKIVSRSDQEPSTTWQVASQVEHAHGCCPSTPEERLRSQSETLTNWSNSLLSLSKFEEASKLLAAARALIELAGGVDCAPGVWLVTAEAHVELLQGRTEPALALFEQALALSRQVNGDKHPATAVCQCNLAETYLEAGRFAEAKDLMLPGLEVLKDPSSVMGNFTGEYLAGAVASFTSTLERILKETMPVPEVSPAE